MNNSYAGHLERTTVSQLNTEEQAWLKDQLTAARDFVDRFSPQDANVAIDSEVLDRAFTAWADHVDTSDVPQANRVINCVGVAFGQLLVVEVGVRWVIATDDKGSDLALYGLPGAADFLVYPTNFVAKRWVRREVNFFRTAHDQLCRDFNRLAKRRESLQE